MEVKLKELMKAKDVTQKDLAEALGMPQSTISRWASGKVDRLDRDIMARLCEYFDCDIEDLLELNKG